MLIFSTSLHGKSKRLIVACLLVFASVFSARSQCVCTNCPQFMPDNFVGDFLINVMGATNNTLGQNGQGVCGVNVHFDHEYLGDLSIVLTSPGGQSVTLVGPIGFFGGTDFSEWDVSFVPCGDAANPDPGFTAQWNNNQPWGMFGNYTGSYYPNQGCLENFNSGPVNGTWTLTVTDGQAVDVGNFYNYEIIFCDPSGIECISCAAEGGELTQPDVSACQGANSLVLNLPPSYPPPTVPPPASDYSYTYVIAGPGGIIMEYSDSPDLTGYDPGVYTVCGFSYYSAQAGLIPPIDGSLTLTQLTNMLASNNPPLCGDISGNCVNVTINSSPPDEEEFAEICAPMCYEFHNQNYCQSGTYVRNLVSPQGCPYTATLYLTVGQPSIKNITQIICEDGCSTVPGFEGYCGAGTYQEVFTNQVGCDSIVNVTLQVMNIVANIVPPGDLSCIQPTIQLSGAGSTTGSGTTYHWTASNGGHIVGNPNTINTLVDDPGDYQLLVCRSTGGAYCCDSAEVTVYTNETPPDPPASIVGSNNVCFGEILSFSATTVADATSYIWTVPPGVVINSGQNTQTINVTWNSPNGGDVCASASNSCGTSTPTCLPVTVSPPLVPAQPAGPISVCAGQTANYSIPALPGALDYIWSTTGGGVITSGQGTNTVVVTWGTTNGTICVKVTGDCGTSQDVCLPVTVTTIPAVPVITGPSTACPGGSVNYSVANVPGATTYNWQITNGSITSGQSTNAVVVTWNANATSGIVCVVAANSCGSSADTCKNVSLSIPVAGQITHVCTTTNQYYTVSFPISGGTSPYTLFSGTPGGVITNGVFTSDSILSGQPYNFVFSDANSCQSAAITGSFSCACSTSSGTMDLTPLSACEDQTVTATHQGGENLDGNDVGAYFLHTNSGTTLGTVLGQNLTGIFGFGAGMTYETTYYISYVVGNNVGGFPDLSDPCLSVSQGQPAIFHQNPIANAGVDADTCGLTLTLAGNSGVGSGTWALISIPNGGNLNISGIHNPNATATATAYGIYQLTWTLDNSGCMDADTVSLDYNDAPLNSNPVPTCDANNENYSVTFTLNGGTPNYTVTGTPNGLLNGSTYTSNPIPNGGNYSYVVTDAAGCVSPPITGTFSCNCASDAGNMDVALLTTCEGGTITATHLGGENLDGNDIGGYFLHTNAGTQLGTVYAENATGAFTFQTGMTYGQTYYVSYVVGTNLNGVPDTTDFCLSVSAGQPVIFYQNPVANAGIDQDTCGIILGLNANTVPNGQGTWTITSGNAANLSIDQPNNPQSAASSDGPGAYTLTWTLSQNGCFGMDQVDVQYNESPTLADLVRSCDAANENFTVALTLSGGTAPYSVNGSPVTGNVFTSNPIANGLTYSFNVTDANGCSMPAVNGAFSCNCATNAGTMPSQPIQACEGTSITVIANGDQSLDANDVVSYVLHSGAGPALGQVFDQNTTGVFTLKSNMTLGQTYYVSVVAGNLVNGFPDPQDPCFSVASGQPVVWLKNPTPNAGVNDEVCGELANLHAAPSGFPGTWTPVNGPGVADFASPNGSTCAVTVSVNGTYDFMWTETNQICSKSDVVSVTFNQNPVIGALTETCNGTNTQYVVSFTVTGGQTPYTVVGLNGSFAGTTFTSGPVANNATYSFGMVDGNGCPADNISGSENCVCTTDAGTMQIAPLVFCANAPATVVWNNDGNTDADDIVQFILHSTPDATVGTVYATNSQPTFNLTSNLVPGQTYYISAIAGSNVNGNINLNDPCLSVAPGVPVSWKPMPTATISGDATICAGTSSVVSFTGTGSYPLTLTYSVGGVQNTLSLASAQNTTLNLTPASTVTYTLVSIADGTAPTCTTMLSDDVTLVVNQPVDAGAANEPVELCQGVGIPVVLSNLITGADIGGQWSETSVVHSLPGAFSAATGTFTTDNQPAGTYTFRYLLTAQAPCANDEETVTVVLTPQPVADAGADKAINCDDVAISLGGPGTSAGAYAWSANGQPAGETKQILVTEPGVYSLTVTSPAGCSDVDEATVILDNQKPVANLTTVKSVKCYGETNGSISLDSVTSAHPPVQYSLNGGPFQSSPLFYNLAPGQYTVTLMDANGCESTTAQLNVAEPPQLVAELGPTIEAALSDSVHLKVMMTVPMTALDTIEWTPLLDSSLIRKADEQHFLPFKSWRVKVRLVDTSGCTAQDEVLILLDKTRHIYIPNVFNPESGLDQILYIYGGRDVEEIESFQIFDRWGTQVFGKDHFQPNDPTVGWDGRYHGKYLDPAVFVYQAVVRFADKEKILFKGDITIVR